MCFRLTKRNLLVLRYFFCWPVLTPLYDDDGVQVEKLVSVGNDVAKPSVTIPGATNSTTMKEMSELKKQSSAADVVRKRKRPSRKTIVGSVSRAVDELQRREVRSSHSELGSVSSGDESSSSSSSASSESSSPPRSASRDRKAKSGGDEAKSARTAVVSQAAKKMLSEALKAAATEVAASLEQDKRPPKELAFARLHRALRGRMEATVWIRAAWSALAMSRQALQAAEGSTGRASPMPRRW